MLFIRLRTCLMKEIRLKFYGYTWEEYAFLISSLKGIYIVYSGCLDAEGAVSLKDVLYVGFHNGIFDLYEKGIIKKIGPFLEDGDRLFLSYSEVPDDEFKEIIVSMINKAVCPKFSNADVSDSFNIKLICEGNCDQIPHEITN